MAELNRKDLISDDALEAPKLLASEFNKVLKVLKEITETGKGIDKNVGSAKSIKAVNVEAEKLTLSQKELQAQTIQIEKAQARLNPEYQKGAKRLTELKVAQQENARKMREQAKESSGLTSEYQKQSARLNRLRKEYKDVALTQGENSKQAKKLRGEVIALDTKLKNVDATVGQHQRNVGNYGMLLGSAGGRAGMLAQQLGVLGGAFRTLGTAMVAIPIFAIVAAFTALYQWFTRTEEGAQKLRIITAALGQIFNSLMDTVSSLGNSLYDAFSNPKEAVNDLWEMIKTNLLNRVTGLIDTFRFAGKAIKAALNFNWDEMNKNAAKAGESILQTVTGVDDLPNKVKASVDSAKKAVKDLYDEVVKDTKEAIALQERENALRVQKRDFLQREVELQDQIAQARLKGNDQEATSAEREKALTEAMELQNQLAEERTALAQEEYEIQRERNKLSNTSEADLEKEAQLRRDVAAIEVQSANEQRRIMSMLSGLRKKNREDVIKEEEKAAQEELEIRKKLEDLKIEAMDDGIDKQIAKIKLETARKIEAITGSEEQILEQRLLLEQIAQNQIDAVREEAAKKEQNWFQKSIRTIQEYLNDGVNLFFAISDRKIAKLEEEAQAMEAIRDKELEHAEGNEERRSAIQEKFAAKEEQIRKKQNAEKRKQAIADKAMAIFEIGINTASAIMKVWAQLGAVALPVVIGLGVQGAVQAATVIAKPIPQFAKGTDFSPEGPAIVNEQGPELMKTPDGKYQMAYSDGPTMTYLQRGTKVFTAAETEEMLNKSALSGFSSMPSRGSIDRSGDIIKELRENTKAIKKIKGTNVTVISDERWNKKVKERYA